MVPLRGRVVLDSWINGNMIQVISLKRWTPRLSYHPVRIISLVQSYHVVTDSLPAEPYHRVPEALTVLAGCQQSAELPSLEMLDTRKLNARGSNLMRYQVCITTDPVPTIAFLPYQLRRTSGLDGSNLNQRQHDSWVEHNPAERPVQWCPCYADGAPDKLIVPP